MELLLQKAGEDVLPGVWTITTLPLFLDFE